MPTREVRVVKWVVWDGSYCGGIRDCDFMVEEVEAGETYCLRFGSDVIGQRQVIKWARNGRRYRCGKCLKEYR